MRVRIARGFWTSRIGLTLLGLTTLLFLSGTAVFSYYYIQFSRLIDARLSGEVFGGTSRIYTAPRQIFVGQTLAADELAGYLQRAGYTEAEVAGATGRFRKTGNSIEIVPGERAFRGAGGGLRVDFAGKEVARIRSLSGAALAAAELEPELITNLFDQSREKRRLVRFDDLPQILVDAVLAAEDKRFFEHPGFDPIRIFGAAWADLRAGARAQGASTITMQVARSFFFTTERTWRRKLSETLVALQLEQRFSKDQIFELYANQIYIGNRGSFAIRGFGEASMAYFGKDVRQLSLGEAAFLAGILRAPNRYSSPERNPERASEARDRVLRAMQENGMASPEQVEQAQKAPLLTVRAAMESTSAPYFVDMVRDHLLGRFSEAELISQSYRVYTTLDSELQRAAVEAVQAGMKEVDKLLARRYETWRKRGEPVPPAQVALVALDPRSGELKALVGGRDYGVSQLNRALARRQPGSVFKPFVYAAAFNSAVDGAEPQVTPVTTVVDEPTTFYFEDQEYAPNNYGEEFFGTVTLRDALRKSLNVATVKVAEMVGYVRVVDIVRQMGLDPRIQPTPAVALGAYEMTPIEVAAAYTPFATGGERTEPYFLSSVLAADGTALERGAARRRPVLDPRAAYLVTSLLEDVVNRGTGAGVRARGFTAPAAGKTGTSHDGWFAGFTSNLLCVVWVGFDDYRELGLAGAAAAAPIWAEFMRRAVALPAYKDTLPFEPPEGITEVAVDPETLQLATPLCAHPRMEKFILGSEPTEFCIRHGGQTASHGSTPAWLSRIFGQRQPPPPRDPRETLAPGDARESATPAKTPARPGATAKQPAKSAPAQETAEEEKKKGFFERLFGIFGGGKKDKEKSKEPAKGKAPPKSSGQTDRPE